MNNIENQVSNAAKWSIFTEIIIKIISPITNMILARILVPEAFGVVATVTMIVSFTDIFTDAGFQKYIVQHQFLNKEDEDLSICVSFWTNMVISIVLWIAIFIFSDQLADIVGNTGLGHVLYVGALILPMTSFSSIQTAIYRKNLNYKGISFTRVVVKVVPLVITVPLALFGFSYWALIIGNIIGELCNAILLTTMSKWKPKLCYSFKKLEEMVLFCGWTLLETISSWLVTNVGILIIGKLFNEYYLGIYKTGTTMVTQITSLIAGATISVLFSALSRLQNNKKEFENMYFSFLKWVGLLVIPLGVGIFLYNDVVTDVLLGNQWGDAELLVGLWGFVLAESVIFNDMSGVVILAKGHPKLLFFSNMIQAALMIPALYFSSQYGFQTLVIVGSLVRIQLPITQTLLAQKVSGIKAMEVIKHLKCFIFSAGVMAIFAILTKQIMSTPILRYLSILICVLVYFCCLYLIPSSRNELRRVFKTAIRKRKI